MVAYAHIAYYTHKFSGVLKGEGGGGLKSTPPPKKKALHFLSEYVILYGSSENVDHTAIEVNNCLSR